MASKSKKKPPTSLSDGHESRRWREGAAGPRDAEIALGPLSVQLLPKTTSYELPRRSARKKNKTGPSFNAMGKNNGNYKNGACSQAASDAQRKAANAAKCRKWRAKQRRLK